MNCSCISLCIDEGASESETSMIKAMGTTICGECKETILAGETYEFNLSVYDGEQSAHRTCIDCLSIRDAFFCDGWYYEEVWYLVREHIDELARYGEIPNGACMASLTKPARDDLCDMIEDVWAELDEKDSED